MRLIATLMFSLLLIVGCDRAQSTPTSGSGPSTAPADASAVAALDPATEPATQPHASFMLIEQKRLQFPPAKLALRSKGGQVFALLFSDDPPDALDDDYTGNSFYFEMTLDITSADQLSTARWMYRAPTSDRMDTNIGIFLNGRRQHLQPSDVVIEFDDRVTPVKVFLSGTFKKFDAGFDPTIPGLHVPVRAELDASVNVKR